jgi:hypothetical protein
MDNGFTGAKQFLRYSQAKASYAQPMNKRLFSRWVLEKISNL